MKISNSQYATALYEVTQKKSQSEIDITVSNFVKILAKNNQIKNSNGIINKFREIWNKNEGIIKAEITSREKLSRQLIKILMKFVAGKYKVEKVEVAEIINPNIKGGIIIRVEDEVMDYSISRNLKDLKDELIS